MLKSYLSTLSYQASKELEIIHHLHGHLLTQPKSKKQLGSHWMKNQLKAPFVKEPMGTFPLGEESLALAKQTPRHLEQGPRQAGKKAPR